MEINNIICNCLLRSSSPEGQTVGYATARYPETTNVEYPERKSEKRNQRVKGAVQYRKWSREKLREWIGSYGTDYKKDSL